MGDRVVEDAQRRACVHCDTGARHPQFACLLSSVPPAGSVPVRVGKRDASAHTSSWDSDCQPVWQLKCHNRDRRYVRGAKATKFGAPHHKNALVIGPFTCNAKAFVRVMKANNRKLKNRIVRGVRLAQVWHLIDPQQGAAQPLRMWCPDAEHRTRFASLLSETVHDEHAANQMVALSAAAARELATTSPPTLTGET